MTASATRRIRASKCRRASMCRGASTFQGVLVGAALLASMATIGSSSPVMAQLAQEAATPSHVRCSLLIGGRVSSLPTADGTNATLGVAHDFLVEGETGKVTHVIVRSGGLAGVGDTLRCFAFDGLTIEVPRDAKPTLTLGHTANTFAATPSIGARDLDPFRAEIIATQGHGLGPPPQRFTPRSPILLLSELPELGVVCTEDGQELGATRDAWLDVVGRAVVYVSLRAGEREIPVPWVRGSIVAFPRARALRLCVALSDTGLDAAPSLEEGGLTLDDDAFRRKVEAHFALATAAGPRASRPGAHGRSTLATH